MAQQANPKSTTLSRAKVGFLVMAILTPLQLIPCQSLSFRNNKRGTTPFTHKIPTSAEDFSVNEHDIPPTKSSSKSRLKTFRITKKQFSKAKSAHAASNDVSPGVSKPRARREHRRREFAGVESMFSTAKQMRKVPIGRLTESWKRRWRRRVLLKHHRRSQKQLNQDGISAIDITTTEEEEEDGEAAELSAIDNLDIWSIEEARQNLRIPSWACVDTDEERRLAAMKILLDKELRAISEKTIAIQVQDEGGKSASVKKSVVDAFPDVYGDLRLLRFLRKDTIQDPVTAAGRYSDFLSWRSENNIDEIRARVESQGPFHTPPELSIVADYLPNNFQVQPESDNKHILHEKSTKQKNHSSEQADKATIPVFLHIGTWDTATITKSIKSNTLPLEQFLQYWTYMFESLYAELHERSLLLQEMVYIDEICDLNKMNLQQFSPAFVQTVLKPFVNLTQKNYPETAASIVLLNPPRILNMVWKILTPMVSPSTLEKIRLHAGFAGSCIDFFKEQQERQGQQELSQKSNAALQP